MKESINPHEKQLLLELAREAITWASRGEPVAKVNLSRLPARLQQPGACFVTLLGPGNQLRGCIGTVKAHSALAHDVQHNAEGSALRDPRFSPVTPDELSGLKIELSILTHPQPLDFNGPEDLLNKLRPGIDGVIIQKDWQRATLLPSVWTKIPDPVQFLSILCRKAGLPKDAWRQPGLEVAVYQAIKMQEGEPGASPA
jgi:AmmeMemoRadiSam system protein A